MFKKLGGILLALVVSQAQADVLTFDDVPGQSLDQFGPVPAGYHGFNFNCSSCSLDHDRVDWINTGPSSTNWPFGTRSGEFSLLNNFGGTGVVTATDGSDFTFDGVWAKAWAT